MRIKLFEKFMSPFTDETKKVETRMDKISKKKGLAMSGIMALSDWFSGRYMAEGESEDTQQLHAVLHELGKVYNKGKVKGDLYRVCHIKVTKNATEDKLLAIKRAQTGPKHIQSWSSSAEGARWFYKHFVHEQNHSDYARPDWAWVLAKVDAAHLDQLITYEACMQFLYDCEATVEPRCEQLTRHFVDDDMLKLHEVIASCPQKIPLEIVEVFVGTGKDASPKRDGMDMDDILAQIMRNASK